MTNSFENAMNELVKMQEQIDILKNLIMGEDQGPEYDGAGFTEADRSPEVRYIFTKAQLIQYSAHLTERTLNAVKEAIRDTSMDDCAVELELGSYSRTIEINLNNEEIQDTFIDEINNTIELDNDAIEVEMINILEHMDKQGQ